MLLVASVIVVGASALQAVLGMGYGLAASPLLLLLEPAFVPASTILIGMLSSSLGALREREQINWDNVLWGSAARVAGLLVALWLLTGLENASDFKLIFGVLVAVAVLLTAMGLSLPLTRGWLVAMAWISGCMGTVTGVGAPPLALLYQKVNPAIARPTLAAFFAVGCGVSALGLAFIGWLGLKEVLLAIFVIPAMLAGTWLGRRITVSSTRTYRTALLCIAAVASLILILQGLYG